MPLNRWSIIMVALTTAIGLKLPPYSIQAIVQEPEDTTFTEVAAALAPPIAIEFNAQVLEVLETNSIPTTSVPDSTSISMDSSSFVKWMCFSLIIVKDFVSGEHPPLVVVVVLFPSPCKLG